MQNVLLILLLALVGCAASPKNLDAVARAEAARLGEPQRPLASFAAYELAPIGMSADVANDARKRTAAGEFEKRLRAALDPVFAEWGQDAAANPADRSGTLVVRVEVMALRIVSGGARFWTGGFAGDSTLDFDVELLAKGEPTAFTRARVARNAGAAAGGLSVGATDRNLLDYATAIVQRYLVENYAATAGSAAPAADSVIP